MTKEEMLKEIPKTYRVLQTGPDTYIVTYKTGNLGFFGRSSTWKAFKDYACEHERDERYWFEDNDYSTETRAIHSLYEYCLNEKKEKDESRLYPKVVAQGEAE
jgi:hypothetical protein